MHDPASVLHGPELAHGQVLLGQGAPAEGGVVRGDHDEAHVGRGELADQVREGVLEADHRGEGRAGDPEPPRGVSGGEVGPHLLDGLDPPLQEAAERHVLAEGHQVVLDVAVHERALGVVEEVLVAKQAVILPADHADQRGGPDVADGPLHEGAEAGVASRILVQSVLRPDGEVGGIRGEAQVGPGVVLGHDAVLDEAALEGHVLRDVPLDRGDVHGRAVGRGRGDERGQEGEGGRRRQQPRPAPPPRPDAGGDDGLERRQDEDVRAGDDEGDSPRPEDGRQREDQRVVVLRGAEAAPGEAAEGQHPADPLDGGPARGERGRRPERAIGPPDGRRSREQQRHPRGLAEDQQRPPQPGDGDEPGHEHGEVDEAEDEAEDRPAPGAPAPHGDEQRDERDEGDGPEVGGRVCQPEGAAGDGGEDEGGGQGEPV